ncbi:hypothetical protein BBAD15_g12560 [Beauveria bassiana D1-5]|uniref:Uncharacterized protein n=1 Tax=Beauveria bassiana D1-5 TaxID=1245745 RepID=A0A0A2V3A3_BEABA|nr:hypothetical protein BBAD15_g12560 [Beauveria bassiana D1-5]
MRLFPPRYISSSLRSCCSSQTTQSNSSLRFYIDNAAPRRQRPTQGRTKQKEKEALTAHLHCVLRKITFRSYRTPSADRIRFTPTVATPHGQRRTGQRPPRPQNETLSDAQADLRNSRRTRAPRSKRSHKERTKQRHDTTDGTPPASSRHNPRPHPPDTHYM